MENIIYNKWVWSVVAVIIIIIAFVSFKSKKEVYTSITPPVEVNTTIVPVTTTPSKEEPVVKTEKPVVPTLSYSDALTKYANRRIQLDPSCQANPNRVTYKDNTGIMIDNRSAKTRTVKLGTTFTLAPYGFKIVVLPDIYLKSKTITMNCDSSVNVATILIQE